MFSSRDKGRIRFRHKGWKFLGESIFTYPNGQINLMAYFATLVGGNMKLSVHNEVKWVTINEIDKYDFAPAVIHLVKKLKEVFLRLVFHH